MCLYYCKLTQMSFGMFGFEHYVDLLSDGLKVTKGISYLGKKKLHNTHIKNWCVVVNIIKFFNGDISLPQASIGLNTLLEEKCVFI